MLAIRGGGRAEDDDAEVVGCLNPNQVQRSMRLLYWIATTSRPASCRYKTVCEPSTGATCDQNSVVHPLLSEGYPDVPAVLESGERRGRPISCYNAVSSRSSACSGLRAGMGKPTSARNRPLATAPSASQAGGRTWVNVCG